MTIHWYRYEDRAVAGSCDENGDPVPGSAYMEITLFEWNVERETPQGAWLTIYGGNKRWASKVSKRRFACSTKLDAIDSYLARKRKQRSIYQSKVYLVEHVIQKAKGIRADLVDKEKGKTTC